jgi:transposase InsO family protein
MNIHKNARLTPHSRGELVRRILVDGQTPKAVASAFGVCVKTAKKWVERFQAEGAAGLVDRSSRPHRLHRPTPEPIADCIAELRRQRWTGKQIAQETGASPATVSRLLKRLGLSRMKDLEPVAPVIRYERKAPGEMIHLDIKKLGRFERVGHRITGDRTGQSSSRGIGWEFVHVCVDDASRLAFCQVMPDGKKESAVAFLKAALAYYESLGVSVARVMTDNGSCYKAFDFRDACRDRDLKHIRTKPYTPKTNGKAERFIQTALREWALCPGLPHVRPQSRRTADLAASIQLASPSWRNKITNADQPTQPFRGQPIEAPHLAHRPLSAAVSGRSRERHQTAVFDPRTVNACSWSPAGRESNVGSRPSRWWKNGLAKRWP